MPESDCNGNKNNICFLLVMIVKHEEKLGGKCQVVVKKPKNGMLLMVNVLIYIVNVGLQLYSST
jgi:hypothetical protein